MAMALGGPSDYHCPTLRQSHARLVGKGPEDSVFDAFLGHFADVMKELGVAAEKIAEIMPIFHGARSDAFGTVILASVLRNRLMGNQREPRRQSILHLRSIIPTHTRSKTQQIGGSRSSEERFISSPAQKHIELRCASIHQ
jgi:hypothetical protein